MKDITSKGYVLDPTIEHLRHHVIKILPEYLEAISRGDKTFEIRIDDQDYQVGDLLILREWTEEGYTDKVLVVDITYIFSRLPSHKNYCKEGMIILGIKVSQFNKLKRVIVSESKDTTVS